MEDMDLLDSEFAKIGCLCFRNLMEIVLPPFGYASGTQVFQDPSLLFGKLYLSLNFRREVFGEPEVGNHMDPEILPDQGQGRNACDKVQSCLVLVKHFNFFWGGSQFLTYKMGTVVLIVLRLAEAFFMGTSGIVWMVNTEESQLLVSAAITVTHFVPITSCY